MKHHQVWSRRETPAASPNYTPSEDGPDVVPAGFVRNTGPGAIHFPITDSRGAVHQPDYVQVAMTYDPFVLAIVKSSPYLYGQALHIRPRLMTARRPRYDPSDLHLFKTYHQERTAVDAAVRSLNDESAIAEVHRYRRLKTEQAKLECNMQRILQSVHDVGMEQEWIQIHMESANLLAQVEFARSLHRPRRGRHS